MNLTDLVIPTPTQAELVAQRILRAHVLGFRQIKASWEARISDIWDAQDPQAIITALGTQAALVFFISAKTIEFLELMEPGSTTAGVAKIKPFTVHEDGTITINA